MLFSSLSWLGILSSLLVCSSEIQVPMSTYMINSPALPGDHPASIQFRAWLDAFNTADKHTLLAYHSDSTFPYSVASRDVGSIERELGLAKTTEGFRIADVESASEPSIVTVVLHERRRKGRYARASMHVNVSVNHFPVTSFQINPIITPIKFIPIDHPRRPEFEKALAPLTADRRRAVLRDLTSVIQKYYVYPDLGTKMADAVESAMKNGEYDDFDDSENFAKRLTEDLHNVSHDKHIRVIFRDPPPNRPKEDDDGTIPPVPHYEDWSRMMFGFGNIEIDEAVLPGKSIGRVEIYGFLPSTAQVASDWKEIRGKMGSLLTEVADVDALLVDLRSNGGGDPATVSFMLSYLVDGSTAIHVLDMLNSTGAIQDSFNTLPAHELPPYTKPFGGTKPLFVLTSADTASGGEEMAYDLQAFKRSIAVIGEGNEHTIGMANPVTKLRHAAEKEFGNGWWILAIPDMKAVHSVTQTNWEGVGVISDVIAGKGEWSTVTSAVEVGKKLAVKALKGEEKSCRV